MRQSRSRAACHKHLAQYQLSSKMCVVVPATGSNSRMRASISSIAARGMAPFRLRTPWPDGTTAGPEGTCDPAAYRVLTPNCAQRYVGQRWLSDVCPNPPSCGLLAFAHRRIVPDHIPGHEGLFGATSTLGLLVALLFPFRCNQWLHLRPKVPLPTGYDLIASTMELLRETDSAHSNWETGLPHATLRSACVFHRIPSAPAVRLRSTDTVAWSTAGGIARQNGALRASRHIIGCGIRHLHGLKVVSSPV